LSRATWKQQKNLDYLSFNMLDLERAQYDIERWIANFVEVPHAALGGWAPCPYARKARLDRDFEVRLGVNPYFDLKVVAQTGITKSVIIFVYESTSYSYEQFHSQLDSANKEFLLNKDLLALEDHPAAPEIVNGVCMNQGTYALALVQSLSDLNQRTKTIARQGFYDVWPEDYLQELFQHRQDPRT
jgi:hypothetical protein